MDSDIQPGTVLAGRYRLTRVIGSGGFGRVWEAEDRQLQRAVAIKEVMLSLLPPEQQKERLERALREGRNAAALADHPHIVSVYDVLIEAGKPWIVMQLVRGVSLRQKLLSDPEDPAAAKTPLDVATVSKIAEAILSALRALHAAKILHRDIKPGNILLSDDGHILLTDFGIAKAETDSTVTVSGSFMGTMAYIAPERAEGEDDEPKSDLFSLGVTLFEAVEGTSPFERSSKTGTLTAILTKPLPPMSRAGTLAPLITALTLKPPEQRPTVEQAEALLTGGTGKGTAAWQAPSPDDVDTAAVPAPANAGGGANARAKMPWESVTLTGSAGLPRPPVINTPQPSASGAGPSKPVGWETIGGGIALVAAAVIGLGWWSSHHNDQQSAPPARSAATTPYSIPPAPVTTAPVTLPVVTTSSTESMAGCKEATDAMGKQHDAMSAAPDMSSDPVGALTAQADAFTNAASDYNTAADAAQDASIRQAIQNLATNATKISSALLQLSRDYSNNQDMTSAKASASALLDQQTVAGEDLLHACQNAAHQ